MTAAAYAADTYAARKRVQAEIYAMCCEWLTGQEPSE